ASRFLAARLVERGVAALIYDKRGVGNSGGDWRTSSLDDLAGDAIAGVELLRHEAGIDPERIGIHGHSQGGTMAPMVAVRSGHVAFIVASSASAVPSDSAEIYSLLNTVYPAAVSRSDSADAHDYVAALVQAAYHGAPRAGFDSLAARVSGRPWYFAPPPPTASYWSFSRSFNEYKPLEWWRQVRVPVLLLYGADDRRVPARESAVRITAAVAQGSSAIDLTTRILPGADHTFRQPPGAGGWPVTARDYLPTLLDWITARR
ncbi:MAG TPA: alpha/beta fold hydrolase, partial [Gemmatimonadaceae bacterium]|nr:alpha/beta fold hydrolase [Gemmatimonadaceae bacterium]